jgi:hypothetical protein
MEKKTQFFCQKIKESTNHMKEARAIAAAAASLPSPTIASSSLVQNPHPNFRSGLRSSSSSSSSSSHRSVLFRSPSPSSSSSRCY